jgi:hypothetical protein
LVLLLLLQSSFNLSRKEASSSNVLFILHTPLCRIIHGASYVIYDCKVIGKGGCDCLRSLFMSL